MKRDVIDRRRTVWERLFFIIMFLILAVWSLIVIAMLVWALITALKTNLQYVNQPLALPEELHFENFGVAIENFYHNGVGFIGMLYNSTWQVIGGALLSTTMTCITGYVLAQYDFPGKDFIIAIIVFTMMIPIYGSLPANYKLIYDLKLNDSYLYLVTYLGGLNSSALMTYAYYKAIPRSYREAVQIDGGSHLVAFSKVYFPLSKNIFAALFLLSFIGNWNNYETPLLYFDKMPTLALGLYNFQQEIKYVANEPAYFAGTLIVMLPVVIIFIFGSDKIMGKLHMGGLKG